MDPQIADWLVRFAAGAGTLYEWQVNEAGVLEAQVYDFKSDASLFSMCPLTAAMACERGPYTARTSVIHAERYFALREAMTDQIIHAADDTCDHADCATIRAHLLRICRVEEPTP